MKQTVKMQWPKVLLCALGLEPSVCHFCKWERDQASQIEENLGLWSARAAWDGKGKKKKQEPG